VTTNQKTNTNTGAATVLTWLGLMQHFHFVEISSWSCFFLSPLKALRLMLWNMERTSRKLFWIIFSGIQMPWNAHKCGIAEQVHRRLPHLLNVIVFHPPPHALLTVKSHRVWNV
jgi:hypothetical protein